jgi:hypothetical protein
MRQELANCERVCDPLLRTILESASLLGKQGA